MKTFAELADIRKKVKAELESKKLPGKGDTHIAIGLATCGTSAGAKKVYDAFAAEIKAKGIQNVKLDKTGCIGLCKLEPIVDIFQPGKPKITYVNVPLDKVKTIVDEHIVKGKIVNELLAADLGKKANSINDTNFYKKQTRVALANCGNIDADNIDEYIAMEGYVALEKALKTMTGQQIVNIVKDSGLRGRGGGGFPTGNKWQFALDAKNDKKYVCCNADEGDPGAFMDRAVIEGDPFALIEAMTIAGFAVGSDQGYVYIRAEYPMAVQRLNAAIVTAKSYGLLGKNIMGTSFSFDLELRLGSGAFVCGEETALIASIEGQRGEPRPRPPFPAVKGLFGKPTLLNNVETYANIPAIIRDGAKVLNKMGTEKSKGTKVFALGGKINNTGLVEIPMGTTLREVVMDIGGGIPNGKKFKAAQTGGPSGGCIPAHLIDTKIDYDNLIAIGSMMGSGGLIVMDEDNCMVDIAKFFLEFTVEESCGKCTPCRIGNKRLYEMLEKIVDGRGTPELLVEMEELCYYIKENSLCGLGQTAPNPVLSTLKYFRNEYEAHVNQKICPSGVCKKLARYTINKDKCIGCTACARGCPVGAISGEVKKPHTIDQNKCIKCGGCIEKCRVGAISKA
jgi:NADP-reducing hydrogenase subunit HndC